MRNAFSSEGVNGLVIDCADKRAHENTAPIKKSNLYSVFGRMNFTDTLRL